MTRSGFLAAYRSRELSFDETYYDACLAQSANTFFGFQRGLGETAVTVASGDTVAALPEDPILDELVRHYDFARALFDGPDGTS